MEFKQRKLFVRKRFIIKENGVEMHTKDHETDSSIFIHFDNIEPRNKARYYTVKYPKILYAGFVIISIALFRGLFTAGDNWKITLAAAGITSAFGLLAFLLYYLIQIKYFLVELDDDTQMFIINESPDKKSFEAFINELFEKRKDYYRENYFFINYDNPKEKELGKMKWLRNENIISENEFNVVIEEIEEQLAD